MKVTPHSTTRRCRAPGCRVDIPTNNSRGRPPEYCFAHKAKSARYYERHREAVNKKARERGDRLRRERGVPLRFGPGMVLLTESDYLEIAVFVYRYNLYLTQLSLMMGKPKKYFSAIRERIDLYGTARISKAVLDKTRRLMKAVEEALDE